MDYVIVGTAGHVDHGKTVLVKALTGKDTDRLKEEKERGISIELGFAPFKLPDGTNVGIVDVPGHERFIRQMLAGVAGMDLVLLVVAADESIMPQTREHLDIIDLLQVKDGIIVITKKDLVDEEWLQLVQEEIKEAVAGTVLADAPVVSVSAVTGEGMDRLRRLLEEKIADTPPKSAAGRMRLPIDRSFSVTGFGTVVTGTLWSGQVNVGDQVEIMPEKLISRVRNLQVHGETVNHATAGQRVAVNLAGVEVEELHRGQMISEPGLLIPSYRMDAKLKLLASAAKPLKQRTRVRLYLGTAETFARVNLLDREQLERGDSCFCQFLIEKPVVALRQDRFVIRTYSPMYTVGGGVVIDPVANKHKRYRQQVLDQLAIKLKGSPGELIMQVLLQHERMLAAQDLQQEAGLDEADFKQGLEELSREDAIERLIYEGTEFVIAGGVIRKLGETARLLLTDFHQKYPLRTGMAKEELRSRAFSSWSGKEFNAFLHAAANAGLIKIFANEVAHRDFAVQPTPGQKEYMAEIVRLLKETPFQPPAWGDIVSAMAMTETEAAELLGYLIRNNEVKRVSDQLIFTGEAVQEAKRRIGEYIKQNGSVTLGEVRDLLDSSRKYVLPLLEYLDQVKFTKRIQDKRILF